MHRKLLIFLFISLSNFIFCQDKFSEKFGNFDPKHLTQSVFDIDSNAAAITLFEKSTADFGYNDFQGGGWFISTKIHIRKKILKKTAFDQGVVTLQYYSGGTGKDERINNIKGATYNLDGKTELTKSSIFNDKLEKDFYQIKITFPNVKEGSIIEYEYEYFTPLTVRNKPKTWYFQGENPTLWSEMEVTVPSYFYYKIMHSGYLELDLSEQNQVSVNHGYPVPSTGVIGSTNTSGTYYHFAIKNTPAFINETYITTPSDYISKIGFELSSVSIPGDYNRNFSVSWGDIDKTLYDSEYWGRKMKKSNYLEETANKLKLIKLPKERLQAAYDYMQKNFKWNEETGLWMQTDLKKVFENKTGTASELNGVLIALLKEIDIDVAPVILSTRSHGRMNFIFPQLDNFNYTIAQTIVESDTLLVDITDPYIKLGSLPQRCINETARVIYSSSKGENIPIVAKEKYSEYESFSYKFNAELSAIIGSYSAFGTGYLGHDLREKYKTKGDENFKKEILKNYDELELKNLKIDAPEDLEKQFEIKFDFLKKGEEANPDILYLEPILFGKTTKNPFLKATRLFPVNFGHATNQTIAVNIDIPEGYIVDEVPKNVAVSLPENGGKFTFYIVKSEKTIQLQSRLILNKAIYEAFEYEYISQLYNVIVQKHAEQIVLKKKI